MQEQTPGQATSYHKTEQIKVAVRRQNVGFPCASRAEKLRERDESLAAAFTNLEQTHQMLLPSATGRWLWAQRLEQDALPATCLQASGSKWKYWGHWPSTYGEGFKVHLRTLLSRWAGKTSHGYWSVFLVGCWDRLKVQTAAQLLLLLPRVQTNSSDFSLKILLIPIFKTSQELLPSKEDSLNIKTNTRFAFNLFTYMNIESQIEIFREPQKTWSKY